MKKIFLVVSLLFLVAGNGWAEDIVGDTINGKVLHVNNGAVNIQNSGGYLMIKRDALSG